MAHNILRKIDIDQFSSKKKIAESVPSEGDIIGPDDEENPIACMPSDSSKGKHFHLMTKINGKKAVTYIDRNTEGFVCFLTREPELGEVILIENVHMKSAFGKLIRL